MRNSIASLHHQLVSETPPSIPFIHLISRFSRTTSARHITCPEERSADGTEHSLNIITVIAPDLPRDGRDVDSVLVVIGSYNLHYLAVQAREMRIGVLGSRSRCHPCGVIVVRRIVRL
jgi:hypothetical protein